MNPALKQKLDLLLAKGAEALGSPDAQKVAAYLEASILGVIYGALSTYIPAVFRTVAGDAFDKFTQFVEDKTDAALAMLAAAGTQMEQQASAPTPAAPATPAPAVPPSDVLSQIKALFAKL